MTLLQPTVLLTRPQQDCAEMAVWLEGTGVTCVQSPLIAIEPIAGIAVPDQAVAVLLSSANGVSAAPDIGARVCFVIGQRTAKAAQARGWRVGHVAQDAEALVQWLLQSRPKGLLAHLHGEHTRGNIPARLSAAGLPTLSITTYRQPVLPLTDHAQMLLKGDQPVIVPLYSPRIARQFAAKANGAAPLHLITISPAVAQEVNHMSNATLAIADSPDGKAMRAAIAGRLDAFPLLETGKTSK